MTTERELDRLLEESITECQRRERSAFDDVAGRENGPIVLLGAGGLGRRTVAALASVGRPPVAVADNNPGTWGGAIGGVPICSPAEAAAQFRDSATFVVSVWHAGGTHRYEQTREQLFALGCRRVTSIAPLAWKYAEAMLPYYCIDLPHRLLQQASEVRRGFALFADDRSRDEYVRQVRFRLLGDFEGLSHPDAGAQYLDTDLFVKDDAEDFADVGAFDGDTLRAVLSANYEFATYLALEPDATNFAALTDYVESLPSDLARRVDLLRVAAYSERTRMRINAAGSAAATIVPASGPPRDDDIECETLDELFADRRVSFLKLDIEGAEPDALAGAASVIRRDRPVMAVCVYHRQDHLWQLPLLVASMVPGYRYYLRPYNEEGFDLVCYAVPEHRTHTV